MQAIKEEDRIKAVVLVAATLGIFGFIGFQVYGATKPVNSPTISANRTITQGSAVTAGGNAAPAQAQPAPTTNVTVSGVAPNRVDPFRVVLAGPVGPRGTVNLQKPNPLPNPNQSGTTTTGGPPMPTLPPTGPNIPSIAPVFKGSMLGNRRAAVLTINGRDVIINECELRNGVRVVRVSRDEVVIRLAGSKETIILKAAP